MRVAIFASGNGTNFEVLADKFAKKKITGNLVLLFCDHPNAPVIKRAEKFNIPYETFTVKECGNKLDYEKRIVEVLKAHQIDFIALAIPEIIPPPPIGTITTSTFSKSSNISSPIVP